MKLPENWTELPEAKALLHAIVEHALGWALADEDELPRLCSAQRVAERALMCRLGLQEEIAARYGRRKHIEEQVRAAFRRAG